MGQEKLVREILKRKDILDVITNAGVAYVGYKSTGHWSGGLLGLVALKLAQAPNLPASVAGVATLATLGISSTIDGDPPPAPPIATHPILGVAPVGFAALFRWWLERFGAPTLPTMDVPPPPVYRDEPITPGGIQR